MSVVLVVSMALIALCILWLPTYSMALLLRGLGVAGSFAGLRVIMPLQLLAVVVTGWLAHQLGLANPAGYVLAILLASSFVGVFIVWRRRHRGV
ncbi:hypothetical protein [Dyella sp. A6]|uniref:hypothetical protein n=1 Tax=Dyella aluminiiresistens TaxID=3069105 RepID=UPI002E79BA51|nr:hypothetical protein [Dyella sp. A6]